MGISKVNYGDNTLIDLTDDTVSPSNLMSGTTAHDSAGNSITGILEATEITTTISEASTDNQVPSSKCVYENIDNLKPVYITLTIDNDGNLTADKTFEEMIALYEAGRTMYVNYFNLIFPSIAVNSNDGMQMFVFGNTEENLYVQFYCDNNGWEMISGNFLTHKEYIDYILPNRTHWKESTTQIEMLLQEQTMTFNNRRYEELSNITTLVGEMICVEYDYSTYYIEVKQNDGYVYNYVGNLNLKDNNSPNTGEPFYIGFNDNPEESYNVTIIVNDNITEHTFTIYRMQECDIYHKLDNNYLNLTDEVSSDSENPVTSKAVYNAIQNVGDNKMVLNVVFDDENNPIFDKTYDEIITAINNKQDVVFYDNNVIYSCMGDNDDSLIFVSISDGCYSIIKCSSNNVLTSDIISLVTESEINNLKPIYVNLITNNDNITADKTFEEILTYYEAKRLVYVKYNRATFPLISVISIDESNSEIYFELMSPSILRVFVCNNNNVWSVRDYTFLTSSTTLSELSEDETHRTVTDAEKEAWNNKPDLSTVQNAIQSAIGTALGGSY